MDVVETLYAAADRGFIWIRDQIPLWVMVPLSLAAALVDGWLVFR